MVKNKLQVLKSKKIIEKKSNYRVVIPRLKSNEVVVKKVLRTLWGVEKIVRKGWLRRDIITMKCKK